MFVSFLLSEQTTLIMIFYRLRVDETLYSSKKLYFEH